MNNFRIDFSNFMHIENDYVDKDCIIDGINYFDVKIYSISKQNNIKLVHEKNSQGLSHRIQSFEELIYKRPIFHLYLNFKTWVEPYFYRFFVPYHIEIFYNNKLEYSYSLDCRHKLILFNLQPKDQRELYTWMNAIDIFKKNMNCDIAVRNDIVHSTSEFDDIADVKYRSSDEANRHYLKLDIGRYYIPNSNVADPYYHPDGLKDKNSLEIINDILYFSSDLFKKDL